ncbi:prolyl oligopeptidase family serine peptidase [Pedobacter sp. MC2016-05]|uniref:carboxylesterase family protein n=1 Tax=Pedobacter sp. MC2016-05 TaxID=2994474 RepID=UPI002246FEA7|nr:prolyl oligopeptidase family serine peptidase [Pedobacter sp. MC2016-05]MCX2472798.1 prolyl oligopeptidase family serine peptidase [Pedobacter sp. MC2016-05]
MLTANANLAFAQKKTFRKTTIDSLTFTQNRKIVNSLNTNVWLKKAFTLDSIQIPYRLLLPKAPKTGKKGYPLVITFHNSTRIGTDNKQQLEPLAKIWLRPEIYNDYPCYVVAPQFNRRSSNYANDEVGTAIAKPSADVSALLKLIDQLADEYPDIDRNRIYLIGYSMGASTAQNLLNLAPDKFAATISIAAVSDFSNLQKIRLKNIWLIHGEKDDENPYQSSLALFDRLASNKNLVFTTFTNLNHNNIVIPFLLTEEIPKWLFSKWK